MTRRVVLVTMAVSVLMVVVAVFHWGRETSRQDRCEAAGGYYKPLRDGYLCLRVDAVIKLETSK